MDLLLATQAPVGWILDRHSERVRGHGLLGTPISELSFETKQLSLFAHLLPPPPPPFREANPVSSMVTDELIGVRVCEADPRVL